MSIDNTIHEVLLNLGIRPSRVGYFYITDAIHYILDEPVLQRIKIYHDVYERIARKYNVSSLAVEISMRKEENNVYKNADEKILRLIFGNFKDRAELISGKSFLISLAMYIKMRGVDINE